MRQSLEAEKPDSVVRKTAEEFQENEERLRRLLYGSQLLKWPP